MSILSKRKERFTFQGYDWGLEVATTDPYSIKNTSVRPKILVDD